MSSSTFLDLFSKAAPEQLLAPIVVVSLVVVLCCWYGWRYYLRSFALSRQLQALIEAIKGVKQQPNARRRSALARIFNEHPLNHAWQEYAETLRARVE